MTESLDGGLNRKDIGLRIRTIRGERSQKEFANLTGATQSYISDLERGKCFPSVTFLAILSEISGRSYDWILTGKEEPKVTSEPDKPVEPIEPVKPVEPIEPVGPVEDVEEGRAPTGPVPSEIDYIYFQHLLTVLRDAPASEKTRFLKIIVSYLHTYL